MRKRTTDSRGWTTSRRRRITFSARAILLLFVLSTMGGLFTSATPHSAAADELSDAYAKQKALQKLIAKQKSTIADLNSSQAALSREIAGTKDDLAALTANLLAVKVQIVSMTVDVARSQGEVDELVATGAQLDAELGRLVAEAARKQADLNSTKALLAARIREAYDTDRTPILDTVLSSGDFTDVLTEASYHLDFAEQDKALAEQIKADQGVLNVLQQNVTMAKQQTDELHVLADEAKAKLDMQMSDLNDTRKMLAQLQAATEKLLAEQRAAYAKMSRDLSASRLVVDETQRRASDVGIAFSIRTTHTTPEGATTVDGTHVVPFGEPYIITLMVVERAAGGTSTETETRRRLLDSLRVKEP